MKFLLSVLLTVSTLFGVAGNPELNYTISFSEPHSHYVEVNIEVKNCTDKSLDFVIPVWAPGSYMVRDFSQNVEGVKAKMGDKYLAVELIDKTTWRVKGDFKSPLQFSYRVYANELSVRSSYIDILHAYLNGSSVFMYIDGKKQIPISLKINPYKDWKKVTTGLTKNSDWTYKAANYDMLADCPIEIGNHDVFSFQVGKTLHEVAMVNAPSYDAEKLKKDLTKIVEEATLVVGENPNEYYAFIVFHANKGGGGLEHMNSTTLHCNRWTYSTEREYQDFLGLAAHEYFHLWNVKRIRPIELGPFDYKKENYTTFLWFSEGVTSYYDELIPYRAGYLKPEEYITKLSASISSLENTAGASVQPVCESSFYAWNKYYKKNENSGNVTISYYAKGSVVGALLDIEIIKATNGKKNLDDFMRELYAFCNKMNRGFTELEFSNTLSKVAGISLNEFLDKNIKGVESPNYTYYFDAVGCEVKSSNTLSGKVHLGVSTELSNGRLIVKSVTRGTSSHDSGIYANDELIAINDYRLIDSDLNKMLDMFKPGDTINMTVSRDGVLRVVPVILKEGKSLKMEIKRLEKMSEQQEICYKKWLSIE